MIQYYYTKKEWGVVMEKEELKILEELRRILNSKNEAIVILNNYFKGGVGKSKLSTMFAYLTDKFNLKVLMIDKDLQATLTKDLAKTFKVELPRVNFYEGLKNGNLASSIVHLTDNLDLIPGTFDLMLLPKLTRSWTFENESRLLATLLAPLKSDYDLIIIDTVPTPSVYTNNAIVASDYVMIPLQAEEESTNNINELSASVYNRVLNYVLNHELNKNDSQLLEVNLLNQLKLAKRVNLFDYSLEELQAVHEYWRSMNRYSKQVLNKEKVA